MHKTHQVIYLFMFYYSLCDCSSSHLKLFEISYDSMNIGFKDIALGEIALKYHFDEGGIKISRRRYSIELQPF